ncbi:hypothetical protein V5O48_016747 [Marasmius crinis-equi]|uniref:Uncharacterized protein n=2 Tax=Marasmius crinis-equi TaxID=585013 RepID=A0ABR3EQW3_9AGAR
MSDFLHKYIHSHIRDKPDAKRARKIVLASLVVVVTANSFPCGISSHLLQPQIFYNKTFAEGAELSISLAYPKLCTPLKREWPAAIKQLKGLIFGEVEPSLPLKGAWIPETDDSSGYGRIRLKHAFFQERESGAHSVESPIPWDHWPVSDAAKPSFNRLRDADTHDLVPLPVFDMDGKLLQPSQYRSALMNTVVEAHFTLEVWRFGGRSQTFKARIVKLYIVTEPLMILIDSPTKRPRVDSEDENSPLKKRRATSSSQGSGTSSSQKSIASSSQGFGET